ncbi:TetR/AcrR family transcriptional regulator [Mycolicibacterium holsaticum]|uniref:TetR/AcrR family transcriptional regulator n=1 Tax=Mycolicibacterium holsaticum TaxID=152142 RepID=UPI001C7CC006|nr:TetR/AcrR family transcriptional regulator [Mycolicibacterium holsaticum]QZA10782.1 TetR/AcrR family transcriptional regulator [Mycolicibacterium holsaticum DSM 44478 = JCM 12374]UNC11719.1 TetR/AcrR family transcriptional regulator [Mycolicibacterium holsaticum DSM 44478 = JCM 12374]
MTGSDRPVRGTRPANRRHLIVVAATDLFYRNGYAQVSMKEIADRVAIGPSALYRHFSNKEDLLYAVVADALGVVDALLDRLLADPTIEPMAAMAETMLAHRPIGALWHAEARHLSDEARTALRHRLRDIGSRLARVLARQRRGVDDKVTDLLAWCVLAVATSVSFHGLALPTDRFVPLMTEMMRSVACATLPRLRRTPVQAGDGAGTWSPTRREAILNTAMKLFARNGFASVTVEDIGASVGIAGPSVYNHFAAKEDILAAAITRGSELLHADMRRQVARAASPHDALRRLLAGYAEYVFETPDAIALLISEIRELPAHEQHRARAAQHEYIAEWVHLLRQVEPAWDQTLCRIRVQAALGVINDVAATPHLRIFANIDAATIAVSAAVLGLG